VAPDGTVGVNADRFEGQPLRSLNDLTTDARGNYWTDSEGSTPGHSGRALLSACSGPFGT
jgi:sugar lactone lactonase YvrE